MLKLNQVYVAVAVSLVMQSLAPTASWAANNECPSVSASLVALDQIEQEAISNQKIRDGLFDLRKELRENMHQRILLATGTVLTPFVIVMTYIGVLSADGNSKATAGWATALGLEVVAEGSMIYLDVKNVHARNALKAKIDQAESQLKDDEEKLKGFQDRLAECRKASSN